MTPATSTASPSTPSRPWWRHRVVIGILVTLAIAHTVFVPLLIAALEHFIFGTSRFEDLLRDLGVHDEVGYIYKPVVNAIERLFGR